MIENKSILIVEDNVLIGEIVAESISSAGGHPLGPVQSGIAALDMINFNPGPPDAVVIDIGLDGHLSLDIADRLEALGVPFVFATGQPSAIPIRHGHRPVCAKPYTNFELLRALETALTPRGRA